MAWTGKIIRDDDKDIVDAKAIWNVGLPDEFSFSERLSPTQTNLSAFVVKAKNALTQKESVRTKEANWADLLTTKLNT